MATAAISYVFNLDFGALVGGMAMRLRMYTRQGLDTTVVTEVIALSLLTNWLGYLLVGGLVLLLAPPPLPALLRRAQREAVQHDPRDQSGVRERDLGREHRAGVVAEQHRAPERAGPEAEPRHRLREPPRLVVDAPWLARPVRPAIAWRVERDDHAVGGELAHQWLELQRRGGRLVQADDRRARRRAGGGSRLAVVQLAVVEIEVAAAHATCPGDRHGGPRAGGAAAPPGLPSPRLPGFMRPSGSSAVLMSCSNPRAPGSSTSA